MRRLRRGGIGLALVALSGCVTFYQPQLALQRPVAVDPQQPTNFTATRVLVRCHPAEGVEADVLCRNVRSSLSKQGAKVTTEIVRPNARAPESKEATEAPQYVIDITSKLLDHSENFLLNVLFAVSFTLVPSWEEWTFSQDVRVRDATGFVLAQQSFQERFVETVGLGIWGINAIVDLLIRPKDEQVTGDGAKAEFTRDLHAHLAQLLHNARVRARVMNSFEPEPSAEAAKGTAP